MNSNDYTNPYDAPEFEAASPEVAKSEPITEPSNYVLLGLVFISTVWLLALIWLNGYAGIGYKTVGSLILLYMIRGVYRRNIKVCFVLLLYLVGSSLVQFFLIKSGMEDPMIKDYLPPNAWRDFAIAQTPKFLLGISVVIIYLKIRKQKVLSTESKLSPESAN